jgi:hypothetical protein
MEEYSSLNANSLKNNRKKLHSDLENIKPLLIEEVQKKNIVSESFAKNDLNLISDGYNLKNSQSNEMIIKRMPSNEANLMIFKSKSNILDFKPNYIHKETFEHNLGSNIKEFLKISNLNFNSNQKDSKSSEQKKNDSEYIDSLRLAKSKSNILDYLKSNLIHFNVKNSSDSNESDKFDAANVEFSKSKIVEFEINNKKISEPTDNEAKKQERVTLFESNNQKGLIKSKSENILKKISTFKDITAIDRKRSYSISSKNNEAFDMGIKLDFLSKENLKKRFKCMIHKKIKEALGEREPIINAHSIRTLSKALQELNYNRSKTNDLDHLKNKCKVFVRRKFISMSKLYLE